jgi:dsRNA-specific ribonuclease
MPTQKNKQEERTEAWIGDAVLALYARQWILTQADIAPAQRAEAFTQLTSNQFLASLGEPTSVEASIGKIYQSEGLQAAFEWIEQNCIPLYLKQRRNRQRAPGNFRNKSK